MIAPNFKLEEVDLLFLQKCQTFLEQHVKNHPDQPFFLYHAMQAVHLPSLPAPQFQGKTHAGPHGDFIFEMDWIVGELLATLERLGVADNTIVIFSSDNGPEVIPVYYMRHDYGHDGARPWRGMKRDNWEGGHRVPLIVRWPGKVKAGTVCDQLTSLTDIMATIADIIGYKLPKNAAEDSISMLPAWLGRAKGPIRKYILHQGFRGARTLAIRSGRWKYLDHKGSGGNNYKKHRLLKEYYIPDNEPNAPGQLYDLQTDPGERTNVFLEHPEVVRRLKSLLETSKATGRSRP